jgi:hypothetical protein
MLKMGVLSCLEMDAFFAQNGCMITKHYSAKKTCSLTQLLNTHSESLLFSVLTREHISELKAWIVSHHFGLSNFCSSLNLK